MVQAILLPGDMLLLNIIYYSSVLKLPPQTWLLWSDITSLFLPSKCSSLWLTQPASMISSFRFRRRVQRLTLTAFWDVSLIVSFPQSEETSHCHSLCFCCGWNRNWELVSSLCWQRILKQGRCWVQGTRVKEYTVEEEGEQKTICLPRTFIRSMSWVWKHGGTFNNFTAWGETSLQVQWNQPTR